MPTVHASTDTPTAPRPPFGRWLLAQQHREDDIGALAKAAKRDAGFPKEGDVQSVAKRLNAAGTDGDMYAAFENAALNYAAD